jgi:hypothetical protein
MSARQETKNACLDIFSKFQKNWRGEVSAKDAIIIAKNMQLASLQRKIKEVENIDFDVMQRHGLIVDGVTKDCKR